MAPMYTQEQVDEIVKRVLRRATAGFVVLFLGVMGMYWNGQAVSQGERDAIIHTGDAVSVAGCNRDFEDRQAIRSVLLSAQRIVRAQRRSGAITAERAKEAENFYMESLDSLPLPDCRKADDILSTSPDSVKIPTPLYP